MNRNALPYLLVLTTTFPRWPDDTVPPFVFELSKRLTDSFRVVVLAPHAPGARTCERMQGLIVVRYRYAPATLETLAYEGGITAGLRDRPWRWLLVPMLLVMCRLALAAVLRRRRFVAIHAHWLLPLGLFAVCSGLPTLATAHGADVLALRGRWADALRRYVVRRAAAVTVVGENLRERLVAAGAPAGRIVVQPMGIDAQRTFVPSDTVRPRSGLLFVGRLVEKKGLVILLSAWQDLIRSRPTLTLDVIGTGPEAARLDPLPAGVRTLGALTNSALPEHYRRAEVLVFPSLEATDGDSEGFGLVVIEALACGCRVVASDLPPLRAIAAVCPDLLLTPPGQPAELVATIERALTLPRTHPFVSRTAVLEHWDWAHVAARYRNHLDRLTAG